jgi:hypothetical protein
MALRQRLIAAPMSMRSAINAKCRGCVYDPLAGGTWREQVEACTCRTCPLWGHRPVTTAATKARAADRRELQRIPANSAE